MAIIYRGRVSGSYQYWNENQPIPGGATNITVVNVPVLTASHVDRSVYAPDGISGSLTQLTGSTSYLIAGANITLLSTSNGPITISSTGGGGDAYWQSDVAGNIYATGSAVISSSLNVGLNGAGRGLLRVGTLDISPITGSATTDNLITPNTILNGNILSASNGVWNGINSVALRHEFHILGMGYDSSSNLNQFAATYLVMTHIDASGIQTALGATELSREITGSYAIGWDVNINSNCAVAVTGGMDAGKPINWYIQRIKEMALRNNNTRT